MGSKSDSHRQPPCLVPQPLGRHSVVLASCRDVGSILALSRGRHQGKRASPGRSLPNPASANAFTATASPSHRVQGPPASLTTLGGLRVGAAYPTRDSSAWPPRNGRSPVADTAPRRYPAAPSVTLRTQDLARPLHQS